MRPSFPFQHLLVCFLLLACQSEAQAVIKKLIPLKDVIEAEELLFVAKVEKVDPTTPACTIAVTENLKGEAPFKRMQVNLTGDALAQREQQSQLLLDRLSPGRQMVLFISKQRKEYSAFVYLEGTWFQLKGTVDRETKAVSWAFLHGEPYLRRTFKGTTAELVQVIRDALTGKQAPPPPDEKTPPGYGPKAADDPPAEAKNPIVRVTTGLPLFGVIPSFVLLGPLAVVAAFFPGLFARLAVGMTRWRAFLVVATATTSLSVGYYFIRGYLPDHWLCGPRGFYGLLLILSAAGLLWSGYRHRLLASEQPELTDPPTPRDLVNLFRVAVLIGVVVILIASVAGWTEAIYPAGSRAANGQEASGIGHAFTAIAFGLMLAGVYWLYRLVAHRGLASSPQLCLAGESVALAGLFGLTCMPSLLSQDRPEPIRLEASQATATAATVELFYQSAEYSEVMSPITILKDQLLFGMTKVSGFRQSGTVVCLDRISKQERWRFDDQGGLKPVFGQVAVADGKVYTGEGLHTDSDGRLFALDLWTGQPSWSRPFTTTSHTEGSPAVVAGKVYFAAGDDGLYCVNAADGQLIWQLDGQQERLHCDSPVAVAAGKLFAGSGYKTLAVFAVDATTGKYLWKSPVSLRSFGPPLVLGDKVCFGLGTGNLADELNQEPDGAPTETQPAGSVIGLNASTGQGLWEYRLPNSVHTELAADSRSLYFTCRDGTIQSLNWRTGQPRWRINLGGTLATGPVLATDHGVPLALYVVTQEGLLVAINPLNGQQLWGQDLRELAGQEVTVISMPRLAEVGSRELFFGAMLTNRNTGNKSAAVFRIRDPAIE